MLQLGFRFVHILRRMMPIAMCALVCSCILTLVQAAVALGGALIKHIASCGVFKRQSNSMLYELQLLAAALRLRTVCRYLLQKDGQFPTGHDLFLKRVGASFHTFIEVSPMPSSWTMSSAVCIPSLLTILRPDSRSHCQCCRSTTVANCI